MKIRLKIKENNKTLDLKAALADGRVTIQENEIVAGKKVESALSTLLVDDDDNEIYENDTICDGENRFFKIVYRDGAFIAHSQNKAEGFSDMPLYLLQSKGRVPARICEKQD